MNTKYYIVNFSISEELINAPKASISYQKHRRDTDRSFCLKKQNTAHYAGRGDESLEF